MGREIAPLDLPEPEYDPERDLAYWLESADPLDPNVLRVLYAGYGQDVQRLVMWLLEEGIHLDALEVRRAVNLTFKLALARLRDFAARKVCAPGSWAWHWRL